MSDAFDPYLRWLGIRDAARPPNHYRLLGLDLFENDSDVIAVAADRQMAHLRTFQTSQFAALSQRVLNELAAARICLLKPEKKAVYDALLKKQLGGMAVAVRAKPQAAPSTLDGADPAAPLPVAARTIVATNDGTPSAGPREAVAEEFPDFASLASATSTSGRAASPSVKKSPAKKSTVNKSAVSARKPKSLGPWIGLAVAGILLVVGVIVVQWMGDSTEVATTDGSKSPASPAATGTVAPSNPVPSKVSRKALAAGGVSGTVATSNPVPSKGNADRKPVPGSESPVRHDKSSSPTLAPTASQPNPNAATPTAVQPASPLPLPKNSPPEPPVHAPRDVIRVDNPVQHDPAHPTPANPGVVANTPTQVAQVDTGKPGVNGGNTTGGNTTDGHDQETHSTPKNPGPVDQANDSKPKRAPVPSKDQITAAETKVQKLFNVSAAKKPDERAALAKTLYDQGIDPNNQEVDRYVLLRKAMKDAAALGNADLALQAANKLGDRFDVNALQEKISVLATLGKTVRTSSAAQVVLGTATDMLDSALSADDFDAAKSLTQLASGLAAKSGDAALARQMRQRLAEIEQIKKEYTKAASARDTLQTKSDDPEANYIWGYYVGPIKGDFDRGLPYLAKGSEKGCADMAIKELTQPTDPKTQTALADGWLEFSNNEREPARAHLRSHAAEWYSQAAEKLSGLEKKRVEDQLARLEPPTKTLAVGGKNFVKFLIDATWTITWLPNANATDGHTKNGAVYKAMTFYPNGACSNNYLSGSWTQDGPSSVVVHYPGNPTVLQRFVLGSKGQLECEYDSPPGTLQNRGLGIKDGARSN